MLCTLIYIPWFRPISDNSKSNSKTHKVESNCFLETNLHRSILFRNGVVKVFDESTGSEVDLQSRFLNSAKGFNEIIPFIFCMKITNKLLVLT